MLKKKKFWIRFAIGILVTPIFAFGVIIGVLYAQQDSYVKRLIEDLNKDFQGKIEISDSHIAPFENFPRISIVMEGLKIIEDKKSESKSVLDLDNIYLGFDLYDILSGNLLIEEIKLEGGHIDLVQYTNGDFNIVKAFETGEVDSSSSSLNLDLKVIHLKNVDVTTYLEESDILVETYFTDASSNFSMIEDVIDFTFDSRFVFNMVMEGDTLPYVKHKDFELSTDLSYGLKSGKVSIYPSKIILEGATYQWEGNVDLEDDMNMDLTFKGANNNFDIIVAFLDDSLRNQILDFKNGGDIFFNANAKGKVVGGQLPSITAEFGCKDAYFKNDKTGAKIDSINFLTKFTAKDIGDLTSMEVEVIDLYALPGKGKVSGYVKVKNFEAPHIVTKLKSSVDLAFVSDLIELDDIQKMTGKMFLNINFDDKVDIGSVENNITALNESYFSELVIEDLYLKTKHFHLPIKDLDVKLAMDSKKLTIDQFNVVLGKSDINVKGVVSNITEFIKDSGKNVEAEMKITSSFLDMTQLTYKNKNRSVSDEEIQDLKLHFSFSSTAKKILKSPYIPMGKFNVQHFYATLKHYPHRFHDFYAELDVGSKDIVINRFSGKMDKSDFFFSGKLNGYDIWFERLPVGTSSFQYDLNSNLMEIGRVFQYENQNFVPEDFQRERLQNLKIKGTTTLSFNKELEYINTDLEQFQAKMEIHEMMFQKFSGGIYYGGDKIVLKKFGGKMGQSDFTIDMDYYLGSDPDKLKVQNKISLKSSNLDLNQLLKYNPQIEGDSLKSSIAAAKNEEPFDLDKLSLPNTKMKYDLKHFVYHEYTLDNLLGGMTISNLVDNDGKEKIITLDTTTFNTAGGKILIKGYFERDTKRNDNYRYKFFPKMSFQSVILDELPVSFELDGQQKHLSDLVSGRMSMGLYGFFHIKRDLTPLIDSALFHMHPTIYNGVLKNYSPLLAMQSYFKDKNVSRLRFDTLGGYEPVLVNNKPVYKPNGEMEKTPKVHIYYVLGEVVFKKPMTINSSIGTMDFMGKQKIYAEMDMDYRVRVPLKMVSQVGLKSMLGKKKEVDLEKEDEIIYKSDKKVNYLNLKIVGPLYPASGKTKDEYTIKLGGKKDWD